MGDVKFDLIHTSSTSTTAADLGNVFTFDVEVDLPHIEDVTDVKMEIFSLDPVTGVGGFAFCDPIIKSAGTGIESSTANLTDPPKTLEKMIDHPSIVSCNDGSGPGTRNVETLVSEVHAMEKCV